jgi:peptidoglycan/xylan/chitin deacetylase (PgdA/CDA1 family)
MDEATERDHMRLAVDAIRRMTGSAPVGWYTGRDSPNTRRLLIEHGGFLYDADSYADDLPYWVEVNGTPHLVVPYTLDTNDMRFATAQGFNSGEQFFQYLRDATQDDVRRTALPHCRAAGAVFGSMPLPRSCAAPR